MWVAIFTAIYLVTAIIILPATKAVHSRYAFVRRLSAAGYFDDLQQEDIVRLKRELKGKAWLKKGFFDQSRMVFAGADDLAKGGFENLAESLQPALSRFGIPRLNARQGADDEGHWAAVDGGKTYLATPIDHQTDRLGGKPGWGWGVAAIRVLDLINSHLARSSDRYRAYAISGGEEMVIAILTPEQQALIAGRASPQVRPYAMTYDYPSFGMPA